VARGNLPGYWWIATAANFWRGDMLVPESRMNLSAATQAAEMQHYLRRARRGADALPAERMR
jgi:hypothetical protein